jgi:hypothetical protein
LWEGEGVQDAVHGENDVLAAVKLVGHRRSKKFTAHVDVPKRFSVCWIQCEQVARVVCCKEQAASRGENAGETLAVSDFVVPDNFAVAIVERADRGVGPEDAVAPASTFGFCGDRVVVHAEEAPRIDEE